MILADLCEFYNQCDFAEVLSLVECRSLTGYEKCGLQEGEADI